VKVFVYNYRMFDEDEYFVRYTRELGLELAYTEESPSLENCHLAEGCDCISVYTTSITAAMLDEFKRLGVRMVSTRTIGYNHIDIQHAKEIGMIVTHITYDPDGVAEYTVMDILMAVRKMKEIMARTMTGDFTLEGMLAGTLKNMTVGIIGAGNIGRSVLRDLSGFGCRLVYYNRSRSEEAERYASYLPLNDLLAQCDIVSLHLELNSQTEHFIDRDAIARMKDGAILVNTARGPLIDTEAMIEALRNGKLSAAAVDVVENEIGLYYRDCSDMDLEDHYIGILRKMPNVIFTHHMAYYYNTAVRDMVYNCLYGMKMLDEGKEIPLRLV